MNRDYCKETPLPYGTPVLYNRDLPRERLLLNGPKSLSDRELLAVLLNTGIKGKNVGILAAEVLDKLDRINGIPPVKEMAGIPGMGNAKACIVAAALELGRRRWGEPGLVITEPRDVFNMVRHYADRRQERFICVSMSGAHEVLAVRVVTVGLVNKTIIHPREVFSDPIQDRASTIVVAHNHPSGHLAPSGEDMAITVRLKNAGEILGIRLLDHLVFSEQSFFSFKTEKAPDPDFWIV